MTNKIASFISFIVLVSLMSLTLQQQLFSNNEFTSNFQQQQQHRQQQRQLQEQPRSLSRFDPYFVHPDKWNEIQYQMNRVWPATTTATTITTPTTTATARQTAATSSPLNNQEGETPTTVANTRNDRNRKNLNEWNLNHHHNHHHHHRHHHHHQQPQQPQQPQQQQLRVPRQQPQSYTVYVNNRPIIPTKIPFSNSTTTATPEHLDCLQKCPTTNEFNPVCATNRQTYHNEQKFNCAIYCGAKIRIVHRGNCEI